MRKDIIQKLLKASNMLLIALVFEAAWLGYYLPQIQRDYAGYASILIYALYCCLYVMYIKIYDGFLIFSTRIYELICGQLLSSMIADALMFVVVWLISGRFPNVMPMIVVYIAQAAISTFWSVLAHRWYFVNHAPQEVMLVCDDAEELEDFIGDASFASRFNLVDTVSPAELIASDFVQLDDAKTVFIHCAEGELRTKVLNKCLDKKKLVYFLPSIEDIVMHGSKSVHLFYHSVLRVRNVEPRMEYGFIKRCFDVVISALALVILSPVMLVVAIAIKMEDGGPVFFQQKRLTMGRKSFNILKFRSMRVDAEKDGVARLSSGDHDSRVTKVGRFIRKTRIDELPQLWNVFVGEMSIVGPRPERPELTELYEKEIPQFGQRLAVKAGLTGYAQVYGKYNTTPKNKLIMDMVYIQNRGIWEDLQIIFATVKVILMPEATEGIAEGQTTALKAKKKKAQKESA